MTTEQHVLEYIREQWEATTADIVYHFVQTLGLSSEIILKSIINLERAKKIERVKRDDDTWFRMAGNSQEPRGKQ